MRYFFLAFLFFTQVSVAQKQQSNFRPDTVRTRDIRERLIQLAMQGPGYEIMDHNAQVASYNIRIAKSAYLGLFSAQGNINEFTITGTPTSTGVAIPYYYPKYNFSLNIPFDIFTRTSNTVKIAKQNYYASTAAKNQKFRDIKADVLTKYENYLLAKQLVELQGKVTQSEYATLKRAEGDFGENLIKLDDVERAQRLYTNEQVKSLKALQKEGTEPLKN